MQGIILVLYKDMRVLDISSEGGGQGLLDCVKQGFMNVFMAKDEYASTLRAAYQQRLDEMKSDERDKAADYRALNEHYNQQLITS